MRKKSRRPSKKTIDDYAFSFKLFKKKHEAMKKRADIESLKKFAYLVDKHFPKECSAERNQAIVLFVDLLITVSDYILIGATSDVNLAKRWIGLMESFDKLSVSKTEDLPMEIDPTGHEVDSLYMKLIMAVNSILDYLKLKEIKK